jgi:hypothetical protein
MHSVPGGAARGSQKDFLEGVTLKEEAQGGKKKKNCPRQKEGTYEISGGQKVPWVASKDITSEDKQGCDLGCHPRYLPTGVSNRWRNDKKRQKGKKEVERERRSGRAHGLLL